KVIHRGRPTPINADFWRNRLDAAMAIRAELIAGGHTTGYRCVNGENDGFPGLVLDRYTDTLVLKLYSAAWFAHLTTLIPVIVAALAPKAIVLRLARTLSDGKLHGLEEGMALYGESPGAPVMFYEHDLHVEADVVHGQKTGYFLDQRDNRALVGSMAGGARVLDVFAATGGFGLHAAAGGAVSVLSVDASAPTLAVAARNMAHNKRNPGVAACAHTSEVGDAFEVLDRFVRQHRKYDIVVLDPPSFAQRAVNVPRALQAYGQLTERGVRLLEPGGLLFQASCSSRVTADELAATVRGAAGRAGFDLKIVRQTGHAVDHPVTFAQGGYLKAVFARVQPL
ncbi:MAG: class I SAM-dependent rRNA methyltransferase, partial [Ilumatobacteraceae bacterium]